MVIDTSVLVAILLRESDSEEYVFKIAEAEIRLLSAASYLEASVVLQARRGRDVDIELDRMIAEMGIVIIPMTAIHARIGRQAYWDYGKGRHPAKLNLGDCFAYALSKQTGEALLFKGNDFSATDVLCG